MASRAARRVSPMGGETILIVEDDESVRKVATIFLTGLGYNVLAAADGPAALSLLEAQPIDLLFTDVVLSGGLSGPELARKARRRRPELKVLYTSGYTENAILHQGRLDAGVQLLGKPYDKEALARKVRAVLEGRPE